MRYLRHHQPKMPPRSRLFYRCLGQQSGKFIGIQFQRGRIPLHNPSSHISRPFADLRVIPKHRRNQSFYSPQIGFGLASHSRARAKPHRPPSSARIR